MRLTRLALLMGATWLAMACGGAAIPQERLTSAEGAVRAAEAGGAPTVPQAALHLKKAQDHIAQAKALIADDENERADFVLQRAEVDAELALAQAREDQAKKEAQEAIDMVEELRSKSGTGKAQ